MKLIKVLMMFVLIASANLSWGQEPMRKSAEVVQIVDRELTAALLKGDSASVDSILADAYIEINAQGLVKYKADIMAIVRSQASAPRATSVGPEVTVDETDLRTHGDTAVLTGHITTRYQFMNNQTSPDTSQPASPASVEHERFLKVYSKRSGHWQLLASIRTAIVKS
jgi:hypothetical protein